MPQSQTISTECLSGTPAAGRCATEAARCENEAFSTTCAVHIEDCDGGCLAVVAQWQSGSSIQRCPGFNS